MGTKTNTQPHAGAPMDLANMAQAFRADDRIADDKARPFHLAAMLMDRAKALALPFTPYQVAQDAAFFVQVERRVMALAVRQCNVGLNDRQEEERERLAKKANIRAQWYNLTASCHGDPRGAVMRLHGEGVERTGWGDGFIV